MTDRKCGNSHCDSEFVWGASLTKLESWEKFFISLLIFKFASDLYSIGTYILDNYGHFNCHVSQEYFEGNFGKHASHLRPQSYRGIYKYYFFVKYAPTLEFDNRVYDFSAPYGWQSFDNDFGCL